MSPLFIKTLKIVFGINHQKWFVLEKKKAFKNVVLFVVVILLWSFKISILDTPLALSVERMHSIACWNYVLTKRSLLKLAAQSPPGRAAGRLRERRFNQR